MALRMSSRTTRFGFAATAGQPFGPTIAKMAPCGSRQWAIQLPPGALMAASQPLIAQEVLNSYPIHRHRCLLDVGGGEGVFLAAVAARAPPLRLMLLDLPAVAERARARLADAGSPGASFNLWRQLPTTARCRRGGCYLAHPDCS